MADERIPEVFYQLTKSTLALTLCRMVDGLDFISALSKSLQEAKNEAVKMMAEATAKDEAEALETTNS